MGKKMLHIFYVEDDENSRNLMYMIERINPNFMSVITMPDSQDFESQLLALDPKPDIILLDIHVPPLDGFEMLNIIRQHSQFDSIPVTALTASVMNEEIEQLRVAGFYSVIAKPIDMDEFPRLLERICNGETLWLI